MEGLRGGGGGGGDRKNCKWPNPKGREKWNLDRVKPLGNQGKAGNGR